MEQTGVRLTRELEKVLLRNIKIGILKELRRQNMLTDSQLERLIRRQNN